MKPTTGALRAGLMVSGASCGDMPREWVAKNMELFARALGIRCHVPGAGEDYTIAHILSRRWWDDYAWDFAIEEE